MQIVIVDNQPLMRKGLGSLLAMDGKYKVVGEVDTNEEALNLLRVVEPELLIIDLQLVEDSGLNFIAEARSKGYAGKFLIFTTSIRRNDLKTGTF